jgi:vitamin B12 transporter
MFLLAPARAHRAAAAALPLLSLGLASAALAQSAPPASPEPVVVTATRSPQRADQALAQVTVIDRKQIEQAGGRTLAELLGQQAGVQFWSNGGQGKVSSVSLRGLESRHTLLLIDGVRYGSATVGTPSWENIPMESIDRIEIVRGPLSGLYGSEAVGGVVQIFTRGGAQGMRFDAMLAAGSNRTAKASGGLRFGEGAFDGSVQLAYGETDGFSATNERVPFGNFNPDDDGFRQSSGSARLGWRFAEGWRAEAHVLGSDGTNQLDDGPDVDSRVDLRTQVMGLLVAGTVLPDWKTTLRLSRSADDYTTLSSASAFAALGTVGTEQDQFSWENSIATPLGTALILAERLEQEVSRPGAPFAVSERTINGVAAGLNGQAGAHTWQANLRYDRNSQFGSQTTGSLGYGYDITAAWRVAASLGTSFVAPSFNQLYFPGFGNPNLLPEEGEHGEISLRWADAAQQLRVAYFDNRIRSYISSGPQPANIPRIRSDGLSLSYEAVLAGWTLAASADHVDPRNDTAGTPNYGKQLPRRAKDSLVLSADTDLAGWRVGGTWMAVSHSFDDAANTVRVAGYGRVDLRADWAVARDWALGLRLNNVGDKSYETVYGYNQPGREAFVSLRWAPR